MPQIIKKLLTFLFVFLLCFFYSGNIFAQELKSKYFNMNISNSADLFQILKKLDIKYLQHLDVAAPKDASDTKEMLKEAMDTLYLEVSDILDIHMYSFQVNLEILPDKDSFNKVLEQVCGKQSDAPSFYFHERNVIYISLDNIRLGILGHELAHAIISHYFAVPPPEKIQEVLAAYVEYSLNKSLVK